MLLRRGSIGYSDGHGGRQQSTASNLTGLGSLGEIWTRAQCCLSLLVLQGINLNFYHRNNFRVLINKIYTSSTHYMSGKFTSWWRHQMETFSALLTSYAGNSPITGEFPAQRPVTRSFDVFFDLRLNKWLSKQWWGWRFETQSCPLWRHCNVHTKKTSVIIFIKRHFIDT